MRLTQLALASGIAAGGLLIAAPANAQEDPRAALEACDPTDVACLAAAVQVPNPLDERPQLLAIIDECRASAEATAQAADPTDFEALASANAELQQCYVNAETEVDVQR